MDVSTEHQKVEDAAQDVVTVTSEHQKIEDAAQGDIGTSEN